VSAAPRGLQWVSGKREPSRPARRPHKAAPVATALLGTVLAAHGPALLAAFHGRDDRWRRGLRRRGVQRLQRAGVGREAAANRAQHYRSGEHEIGVSDWRFVPRHTRGSRVAIGMEDRAHDFGLRGAPFKGLRAHPA